MDFLVATGAASLGLVIGVVVGLWIYEAESINSRVVKTAIAMLCGGGALGLFHLLAGYEGATREYWVYPIGLRAGFIARCRVGLYRRSCAGKVAIPVTPL